jgi:DcmR-like sensory protein/putative zinc finger protein
MNPPAEMTCRELAELTTAYLEGALPSQEKGRLEAHLHECSSCQAHVSQLRLMVSTLGRLRSSACEDFPAEQSRILDLFRTRGLHRPGKPPRDIPLGLGTELVAPGDHIAYLWESEREFDAIAGFLAAGASSGEACVLIGHDAANERVLAGLERCGLGVGALMQEHQLEVAPVRPSADELLLEIDERIKDMVHRGTPAVRVLGNLNWGRGAPGWPPDREILRLEALVTSVADRLPIIVVCAYDVTRLPGPMLFKGGFECHGQTFRRGHLRLSEHLVPPERFLEELSGGSE